MNASPIGLIGVASELAMSSSLVQASGINSLQLPSGHYKSGPQILEDFTRLVRNPVPRTAFITKGVTDPANHLRLIYDQTLRFKILISLRAGGLHAGQGPSRDVCIVAANDVITFLNTLGLSSRIKPYLPYIPNPPEIVRDRTLLLEDIIRNLQSENDPNSQGRLLSSLYLVLPEMPTEQPDWIEALERVSIVPRLEDVSFLLNVLERSGVGSLIRASGSGPIIPVAVRPNDPAALNIAPQFLRRTFTQVRDRWFADIGNANGRLEEGMLDCPPDDSVLDVFVLGLEKVEILQLEQLLTPHESWAFIASSLSVSGTAGPYWFLVRRTGDINQLKAILERAIPLGSAYLRNRREEIMFGLDSLLSGNPISSGIPFVHELLLASSQAENKREELEASITRNMSNYRRLSDEASKQVQFASQGDISVGSVLQNLVENGLGITDDRAKPYWARVLAEACHEEEDLVALLAVLRTDELRAAHTAAKKAIRLIDFMSYGPNADTTEL